MTKQPYHGDSGDDPLRPMTEEEMKRYEDLEREHFGDAYKQTGIYAPKLKCTSPKFGTGEIYHCLELDCPVHGERNRTISASTKRS